MNEQIDTSFEDFSAAFSGESGNHTEQEETDTKESVDTGSEATPEAASEPVKEEQGGDGTGDTDDAEKPPDGATEPDSGSEGGDAASEYRLEIKVNGNTRQIGEAEARELAQKGSDYDRVKEQRDQARSFQAEHEEVISALKEMAEGMDPPCSLPDMIALMRENVLVTQGVPPEVARERVAREAAERRLQSVEASRKKEAETAASNESRVKKEVQDFSRKYPGVVLSKEQIIALSGDLEQGLSLAEAYQKSEIQKRDAEIERLKQELAAEEKNKKNLVSSPGSQADAGAGHKSSPFDDFMSGFGR